RRSLGLRAVKGHERGIGRGFVQKQGTHRRMGSRGKLLELAQRGPFLSGKPRVQFREGSFQDVDGLTGSFHCPAQNPLRRLHYDPAHGVTPLLSLLQVFTRRDDSTQFRLFLPHWRARTAPGTRCRSAFVRYALFCSRNRYPTPWTVSIKRGSSPVSFSFWRSRRTCTSTVRVPPVYS